MKNFLLFLLVFAGAVFAFSGEISSYVLSDSAVEEFKKLPKALDSTKIFEILEKKKNLYYLDRDAMKNDLIEALTDYPELHKLITNNSYASMAVSKKLMTSVPPEDSIVDYVWLNASDMEIFKSYIRKELKLSTYSSPVAIFLDSLKGIVFADSVMMRDYSLSLFAAFLGVCYDISNTYGKISNAIWNNADVEDVFRRVYRDKVDEKFVKKCIDVDDGLNPFNKKAESKNQMEKDCSINQMLTLRYKNLNCSEDHWRQALKMVDTLYTHLLENVVDSLTQKKSDFFDEVPVVWTAKDCGCSQYRDLNGNVYALYPYWLVRDGGDTLDFSVITRIAYYGIYADDDGNLKLPSGSNALEFFDKPRYSNFVNVAHKHNVKVDWVISKSKWNTLADDSVEMQNFFDNLISKVDLLVSKKNNSWMKRAVSTITFDGRDKGLRGDGVTLWFKNYPTDAKNTDLFKKNFKKLQKILWEKNEFAFVNMMMDLSDLTERMNVRKDSSYVPAERGIYSYEFFRHLLEFSEKRLERNRKYTLSEMNMEQRNLLIVFNHEPVSRNKLVLYNDLNQQMSGDDRTDVLHAVVPMLWFDFKQYEQLKDDASFYNDAFYSLGIAPYGVNDNEKNEDKLSNILLNNFEKEEGSHERQSFIASFFCTNRWIFRMLNTLVYVFVFILLICYFLFCHINVFFTKRLALFVAVVAVPPLLTTLILSNFDPAFMDFIGSIGQWGCFVVIILIVIVITLLQVYRSTDVPKRK